MTSCIDSIRRLKSLQDNLLLKVALSNVKVIDPNVIIILKADLKLKDSFLKALYTLNFYSKIEIIGYLICRVIMK